MATVWAVLLMLALAPVFSASAAALPQAQSRQVEHQEPCDTAAMNDHGAPQKQADDCVAACLAVQGAVLPDAADFAVSRSPAVIRGESLPVHTLAGRLSGLDPPPPRLS